MHAIRSLLYPFSWPYSYVPVLPSHLVDHCESPCPFLFGLLSDNFNYVYGKDLPDVIILRSLQYSDSLISVVDSLHFKVILVSLERNKLYNYSEQDVNVLPQDLVQALTKLCKKVKILFKNGKLIQKQSLKVSSFLSNFFFVYR